MPKATTPAPGRADHRERALEEAARHLERLGYPILARGFDGAELIAAAETRLLVCEVRAEPALHPSASPLERCDRRRLRAAAGSFIAARPGIRWSELRLDLISVYLDQAGELVGLEHTPDAF